MRAYKVTKKYLTLAEAAERSRGRDGQQLAQVSLRAAAARGALRAHKDGDTWMVAPEDLRAYLASRPRWFRPARAVTTGSKRQ